MQSVPIRPRFRPAPGPQTYRLFFLDGAGRRIVNSHEFEAAGDEAAIEVSEAWREGRKMELWQRARIVKDWR